MRPHLPHLSAAALLCWLPLFQATAQNAALPLSRTDSALVGRILLAEDRRDSTDRALLDGGAHADARVRAIAERAVARIRDPHYTARTSAPPLAPSPVWPEPAWRLRYRALNARSGCDALRSALADSTWAVRLRAADLLSSPCAADQVVLATLRGWLDALPANASRRQSGGVSWHAAAHAEVALARLQPAELRGRLGKLATHAQWQVRMYAARAAAVLTDTIRLRALARDPNDNVKEAAINALSKLTGHADDELYLAALSARGAQAVRAAALALKGSPRADVAPAVDVAFRRWVAQDNASARDARVALLAAAGKPESADQPPVERIELPPHAVPLALGEQIRLRVTLAPESGGGSFVIRLRGDAAPMMAARFLALAESGYYDGLTWHRVEPDFLFQGGSPGANEYVGYRRYFRDELGASHVRGAVGMSTRGHDTGDGQWYVDLRDNRRLDPDYTVFAEVVDGIDVVDGVLEGDTIARIERF